MKVECEPMHPDAEGWSDWIHPLPGYLMQCCDCDLIHEMQVCIGQDNDEGAALNEGEERGGPVVLFRMRRASGIAARSDETRSGSAEGKSPVPERQTPSYVSDPQSQKA